jgi:hypothetical protein
VLSTKSAYPPTSGRAWISAVHSWSLGSPQLSLPESFGFALFLAGIGVIHGGEVSKHGRDARPGVGERSGLRAAFLG